MQLVDYHADRMVTCAFCRFDNRADANFCGSCGRAMASAVQCNACGTVNPAAHQFCDGCGSPTSGSQSTDSSTVARIRAAARSLAENVHARLGSYSLDLLVVGVLLAVMAQRSFASQNPAPFPPLSGVIVLSLGVVIFALGSFAHGRGDSASTVWRFAARSATISLSRNTIRLFGIGTVAMASMVLRISRESTSGWDLLLWALTVLVFVIPLLQLARPRLPAIERGRYIDILIVAVLVASFVVLNAHDLEDRYYSAIGDEYAFYLSAKDIIEDGVWRPFRQDGVYGNHPVMSNVYQSVVMRLFGTDYFGWTFSSILSAALTIPGIFVLGYMAGGRKVAVASAVVFTFSHYLFAFAHIGYNQLDSFPITVWAIVLYLLGTHRGSLLLLLFAGLVTGLSLYFHFTARLVIPILFLFTITVERRKWYLLLLGPFGIGFALAALPAVVENRGDLFLGMLPAFVDSYAGADIFERLQRLGEPFEHLRRNLLRSLLAFNYNANVSHYVSGPLLDPVSAILAALGIGLAMSRLRQPLTRLILIWFLVTVTLLGVLSPYPGVSITRMYFVVPPTALLAGMSAGIIIDALSKLRFYEKIKPFPTIVILATMAALVIAWNVRQFWFVTPSVFGISPVAVAMDALQSDVCDGGTRRAVIVSRDTAFPLLVLESYYPDGPLPKLVNYDQLAEWRLPPETDMRCVIFLNPNDDREKAAIQRLELGHVRGRVVNFTDRSQRSSVAVFSLAPADTAASLQNQG